MKFTAINSRNKSLVKKTYEEISVFFTGCSFDFWIKDDILFEFFRSLIMLEFKKIKFYSIHTTYGTQIEKDIMTLSAFLRPGVDISFEFFKEELPENINYNVYLNFSISPEKHLIQKECFIIDFLGIRYNYENQVSTSDNSWIFEEYKNKIDLIKTETSEIYNNTTSNLNQMIGVFNKISKRIKSHYALYPKEEIILNSSNLLNSETYDVVMLQETNLRFQSIVSKIDCAIFLSNLNRNIAQSEASPVFQKIFAIDDPDNALTSREFLIKELNLPFDFKNEFPDKICNSLISYQKFAIRGFGGIGFHVGMNLLETSPIINKYSPNIPSISIIFDDDDIEMHNTTRLPVNRVLSEKLKFKINLIDYTKIPFNYHYGENSNSGELATSELESVYENFLKVSSFNPLQELKETFLRKELSSRSSHFKITSLALTQKSILAQYRFVDFFNTRLVSEKVDLNHNNTSDILIKRKWNFIQPILPPTSFSLSTTSCPGIKEGILIYHMNKLLNYSFQNFKLVIGVKLKLDPLIYNYIKSKNFSFIKNERYLNGNNEANKIEGSFQGEKLWEQKIPLELRQLYEEQIGHTLFEFDEANKSFYQLSSRHLKDLAYYYSLYIIELYIRFSQSDLTFDTIDSTRRSTLGEFDIKLNYDGEEIAITHNSYKYFNSLFGEDPQDGYRVVPSFYTAPRVLGLISEGYMHFGYPKTDKVDQEIFNINEILKALW